MNLILGQSVSRALLAAAIQYAAIDLGALGGGTMSEALGINKSWDILSSAPAGRHGLSCTAMEP